MPEVTCFRDSKPNEKVQKCKASSPTTRILSLSRQADKASSHSASPPVPRTVISQVYRSLRMRRSSRQPVLLPQTTFLQPRSTPTRSLSGTRRLNRRKSSQISFPCLQSPKRPRRSPRPRRKSKLKSKRLSTRSQPKASRAASSFTRTRTTCHKS